MLTIESTPDRVTIWANDDGLKLLEDLIRVAKRNGTAHIAENGSNVVSLVYEKKRGRR